MHRSNCEFKGLKLQHKAAGRLALNFLNLTRKFGCEEEPLSIINANASKPKHSQIFGNIFVNNAIIIAHINVHSIQDQIGLLSHAGKGTWISLWKFLATINSIFIFLLNLVFVLQFFFINLAVYSFYTFKFIVSP